MNPGSGIRVSGRPASSSSDGELACELVECAPALRNRLRRPARWWHRHVAFGAASLVGEARHDGRELRRAEAVEETVADRLREEQVGLGVQARQALARVGERPAVDVAPRLEHAQHAVELAGEAVAAPAHPPLQPLHVALEALDRVRRPEPRPQSRVGGDGVLGERPFELGDPPVVALRAPAAVAAPSPRAAGRRPDAGRPGSRGAWGCGRSMVATRRGGASKSSGPRRTTSRRASMPTMRGVCLRRWSCDSTTTRPAATGDRDDVAGAQRLERVGDAPRTAAAVRACRLQRGLEPCVVEHVAGVAGGELTLALEVPAGALELTLHRHDVTVGVELRERQVEEVVRLELRVPAHQVGRHVVGRAERRGERVGAA